MEVKAIFFTVLRNLTLKNQLAMLLLELVQLFIPAIIKFVGEKLRIAARDGILEDIKSILDKYLGDCVIDEQDVIGYSRCFLKYIVYFIYTYT